MRPAEHIRANVTNDGLVVLDIDKGQIFSANIIAARIWQGIVVDNKPKEEVVDSIVKEWGSTTDVVTRDLDAFVDKLKAQELVVDA
jgi:hypothetical protein